MGFRLCDRRGRSLLFVVRGVLLNLLRQIAVGIKPYDGLALTQIVLQMSESHLPVKLAVLSINADLKRIVESCWVVPPQQRINIRLCYEELRIASLRTQLE